MDWVLALLDFILHIDVHLDGIIRSYGAWTYAILLVVIFCETGLVVTPFLPGDSLLFAAGTFAARGSLNPWLLFALLGTAAVVGDTVNYWIGKVLAPHVVSGRARFIRQDYLDRTHRFYERHGGKTVVLARFVPIVRTFAPFVAGVGAMEYARFVLFNVGGGLAWVALFTFGGYYFGNIPAVEHNFSLVILGIIFVSILPGVFAFVRQRFLVQNAK